RKPLRVPHTLRRCVPRARSAALHPWRCARPACRRRPARDHRARTEYRRRHRGHRTAARRRRFRRPLPPKPRRDLERTRVGSRRRPARPLLRRERHLRQASEPPPVAGLLPRRHVFRAEEAQPRRPVRIAERQRTAASPARKEPPVTYSIVARDPETGELGVGIQTHQPAAGACCPWVEAGVGAVATQATGNVAFGPQALALLKNGLPADRALAAILAADEMPEKRQVAVVDAGGRVAVYTGDACLPYASHRTGDGYSVQANLMARDTVPDAMAEAFELTQGPLPVRILAALDAAEAEGGDLRGRQSAALLVKRDPLDYRWN